MSRQSGSGFCTGHCAGCTTYNCDDWRSEPEPRPVVHLNTVAARVLRDAADATARDDRGPKAAVGTLWSRLHAEPDAIRVAFDALGAAAGVSDTGAYLGAVLRKRTALERAELCRQAANVLEAA